MMKKIWLMLLMGSSVSAFGQHQDPSWSARRAIINEQCVESDSLCNVLHTLGTFEGHLRNFFMGTVNQEDYPDYYALGIGGGLGYYSPIIKNFQVGMSGFIIYNVGSSHLGNNAPYSNRYEIGLFDAENPDNHEDLDRLEDLYLRYYLSQETKSFVQIGKFHLKTPLINLQDGRMRPNLQEGAWLEFNEFKNIKLKGGVLWRTSPRGTIHWYSMGNSIGVYPMGRATNGNKADYAGRISTSHVYLAHATVALTKNLSYQPWNYHAANLFNISLQKLEWKKKTEHNTFLVGIQYLWQKSLYSDTLALERQYITKGEQSHSLSARLSMQHNRSGEEWNINYTRITDHGRFLFPREWGIESFYTFLPRERMEGMGDVHAVMVQNNRTLDKHKHLALQTSAGLYILPSVTDARLNKYALPSFYQVNARLGYTFTGFLHGLKADLLYVYKGNMTKDLEEVPSFVHNKVNMHHASLVLDYYF